MEIYLDVPSAGVPTVEFSMREDGFSFDQFLLTKDRAYRPAGAEQGESLRPVPTPNTSETALENKITPTIK